MPAPKARDQGAKQPQWPLGLTSQDKPIRVAQSIGSKVNPPIGPSVIFSDCIIRGL